jgi:NAD(P)-dependent dehydrogenase (short-subunit alcohol dehydrogenase family)
MVDPLFDIAGHVVLIAGGARGLGRALSKALAERGAIIVVADRLTGEAEQVAASLPHKGHNVQFLDITDEASVEAAIGDTMRHAGRLDVVLNSAGIAEFDPALTLSRERFERTISVNLTGAFLLSRHAARIMIDQGGGSIIHLASISSRVANPQYSAYSSSKAALSQLVRILALEWAVHAVRVNAIGPAMTDTPLTRQQLLTDPEKTAKAVSQIPMGRLGLPEDLIGMVLLLASSAGQFITGQTLYVDGGRTLV